MTENPLNLIEQGRYAEILERYEKLKSPNQRWVVAAIAANAFLGNVKVADIIYRIHKNTFTTAMLVHSQFYLSIAYVRISRFTDAKKLLKLNISLCKNKPELDSYVFQAVGFYYYFIGIFVKALKYSKRALVSSLKYNNKYLRFISTDLYGHSLVQLGQRQMGLRYLKDATQLALELNNKNIAKAISVSCLIYESEVGHQPDQAILKLQKSINELNNVDSYTRSNLILELARQLTIRGKWSEAKNILNHESASIYMQGNRRQELVLQLRLAEIAFRQGDFYTAEHFLQAGKRCLKHVADGNFELRLLGFELKLKKYLGIEINNSIYKRVSALIEKHSDTISKQILFRYGAIPHVEVSESENPLGCIYHLSISNKMKASENALKSGYLGIWSEFLDFHPGKNYFYVFPDLKKFIMVSNAGVHPGAKQLTQTQLKILQAFNSNCTSKEDLVSYVWGHLYRPLDHDPMIHSALNKLRHSLSPNVNWLSTLESGWELSRDVNWLIPEPKQIDKKVSLKIEIPKNILGLSARQINALNELKTQGVWTIKSFKSHYNISTMTAFRDLNGLLKANLLVRTGAGRSTRYYLKEV